jgi:hypothetical protein
MTAATSSELPDVSRSVLQLQVFSIVWMTVEAVVSHVTAWSGVFEVIKSLTHEGAGDTVMLVAAGPTEVSIVDMKCSF